MNDEDTMLIWDNNPPPGKMRACDADRDHVVERLNVAYTPVAATAQHEQTRAGRGRDAGLKSRQSMTPIPNAARATRRMVRESGTVPR